MNVPPWLLTIAGTVGIALCATAIEMWADQRQMRKEIVGTRSFVTDELKEIREELRFTENRFRQQRDTIIDSLRQLYLRAHSHGMPTLNAPTHAQQVWDEEDRRLQEEQRSR